MPRFASTAVLFASLLGLTGCQGNSVDAPAISSTESPPADSESNPATGATSSSAGPGAPESRRPGEAETPAGTVDGASSGSSEAVVSDPRGSASGDAAGTSSSATERPAEAVAAVEAGPPTTASSSAEEAGYVQATPAGAPAELPQSRTFRPEGAEQALRITYDDLDLLKWLQMDPVTPDCVEKMPEWLRGLNGKKVRLRGFMKPHEISTGFRRFIFVKDTGLCCFGPAGKIYDLIQVTLLKGTTTDYIELTPFDVIGTFRIEVAALDDTQEVYELFHIDDARIVRK
ncbi:MAG: hypothetical protein ACK6D3_16920 [Planctomycetaceae bacterium]|jgi:hypothetical protein